MNLMLRFTSHDISRDRDKARSLYRQLADAIRADISDGYLIPGERLPGQVAIAERAGVTPFVARQAIDLLVADGVLEKRNGVPTRVTPARRVREITMNRYVEENARIIAGQRPDTSAFSQGHGIAWEHYGVRLQIRREPATPMDCELLGIEPDSYVWRRYFVKSAEGAPVEIQRSALPDWLVAIEGNEFLIDESRQPAPGGTQWELFDAGFQVTGVRQEADIRMATEDEQRDLRITAQVPVIVFTRQFFHGDRVVECSRLVLSAQRHRIVEQVALRRLKSRGNRR